MTSRKYVDKQHMNETQATYLRQNTRCCISTSRYESSVLFGSGQLWVNVRDEEMKHDVCIQRLTKTRFSNLSIKPNSCEDFVSHSVPFLVSPSLSPTASLIFFTTTTSSRLLQKQNHSLVNVIVRRQVCLPTDNMEDLFCLTAALHLLHPHLNSSSCDSDFNTHLNWFYSNYTNSSKCGDFTFRLMFRWRKDHMSQCFNKLKLNFNTEVCVWGD